MKYDKTKIPGIATDVVKGLIDESTAIALFPEDLQRILRYEISKRRRAMGYDRENIGNTTDAGLHYLADDIVLGIIDEEKAFKQLFRGQHKQLREEIDRRREDEVLWNEALAARTISMFEKYLEAYNNPDLSYKGRYVSRAEEMIQYLKDDDKDWLTAKAANTEEGYTSYLEKYGNAAYSYQGKHIEEAKAAIEELNAAILPDPKELDEAAWVEAEKENTIDGYKRYLKEYGDSTNPGLHVNDAERRICRILDEEAWKKAKSLNTVESYQEYKDFCDANSSPGYKWSHYVVASNNINNLKKLDETRRKREDYESKKKKDDSDWKVAKQVNSIKAYEQYLRLHPDGLRKDAANSAISILKKAEMESYVWNEAKSRNNIHTYQNYLKDYPNGPHVREAELGIKRIKSEDREREDWRKASERHTIEGYEAFIAKYERPVNGFQSLHIEDARDRIQELKEEERAESERHISTPPTPPLPPTFDTTPFPKPISSASIPKKRSNNLGLIILVIVLAFLLTFWTLFLQSRNGGWPFEQDPDTIINDSVVEIVEPISNDSASPYTVNAQAMEDSVLTSVEEDHSNNIEESPMVKPTPVNNVDKNESDKNGDITKNETEPSKKIETNPQKSESGNPKNVNKKPKIESPKINEPSLNNAEIFSNAMKKNDIKTIEGLANKGYTPSYIYLANYYLKKPATHHLAKKYAEKAKKAGIKEADKILSTLDLYDY